MSRRLLLPLALSLGCLTSAIADPLSKKIDIDFFRDVPSRNLKGLATRSDGRLVSGPVVRELTGQAPAELMWTLEPDRASGNWLVGSGPDGRIFELTVDAAATSFTSRELAKLDKVAYIRFASVYRSFDTPDDFREAVLEVKKAPRRK